MASRQGKRLLTIATEHKAVLEVVNAMSSKVFAEFCYPRRVVLDQTCADALRQGTVGVGDARQ